MRGRSRREHGVAAPASVAVLSTATVVVAGIFYLASGGAADEPEPAPAAVPSATPTPTPEVTPSAAAEPTKKAAPKRKQPVVRRAATYVEVYNNSGIPGLAASTGREARGAGWQVVGEDNWFGTISASTVYHPPGELRAARLLARDLDIERIRPAVEPMRFDRLTVILTSDYSGRGR